jgi:hypothetical protein
MDKTNDPENRLKALLLADPAFQRMRALHEQGHYEQSLDLGLQIAQTHPEMGDAWGAAAINCVKLKRWPDAIGYAQTALARGGDVLGMCDVLAHVHGYLRHWDETRRYGLQALDMRAHQFSGEPVMPLPEPGLMPPLPSAQTRQHNVIAFSLFGGDSKYCETAILNVQEQPDIYPHWVCRFYVDGSVPENVLSRLQAGGAQIVRIEGPALQWPGTMWRFLALDDSHAHRILFRDADSVISRREAGAVQQWLTSGKRFHIMRDIGSATELIPAGLWGIVGGSLPPLEQLMQRFRSAPLASRHFADQDFLRQYVWPYACASLMQHDSIFGFMGGVPFPDGAKPDDDLDSVGYSEGTASFTARCNLPNGSAVTWGLHRIVEMPDGNQSRMELVCAYPGTVKDGTVTAHIPERYARWIRQGTARIGFRMNNAA